MPANFDGTSAEPQPNKNTEDVNNRKNKENIPNEQLSEKEEQKRTNHGLTALLRTIKNNPKRRFRMDPYGQQQEKEYTETTYERFIHQ